MAATGGGVTGGGMKKRFGFMNEIRRGKGIDRDKKGGGTSESTHRNGLSGKDSERLDRLSSSLKKVYQTTVDEAVPDSMMDLLKKLG